MMLKHFWAEESGQDLLEYALMAGFLATVGVTVLAAVTPTQATFGAVMHLFSLLLDGGIAQ